MLTLPPKGGGELIFSNGLHDPHPARLEAVLDSKRPASSDFTHGKRKKSDGVIASELGGRGIILMPFAARDNWTEVTMLACLVDPRQNQPWNDNLGLFGFKITRNLIRAFLI